MFCPNCGAEVKDTAKFCTNCGSAIAQVAAPVVEAAAPVVEAAAPVVEAAAPVVEAAAPVVEAAAPVVEAAAPAVEAAAPAAPVYTAPAPEPVSAPQPQYQQPQYQQSAPQYQQPQYQQPQYQQSAPQYQQPQYQQPQYQQPQQPPTPPADKAKPPKKGKTGLIIGIVAAVVVLGVVAFLLFGRGGKADVYNLEEYLTVEYYGTNGQAEAWVDLDWEKLVRDIGTKKELDLKFLDTYDDPGEEWDAIGDAIETIEVKTKNGENLSNGDTVDVTITYDNDVAKKAKLKFQGGDCQFTVEGLQDIPQVDPFEGLDVTFSGKSGDGYVDITYNGPNDLIGSYDFEASEYFGLSNGDEITVTFSGYEGFEDYYGFEPTRMENTYVVEGLAEVLKSMSDLDPAWFASLQACAEEHVRSSIADYSDGADYTIDTLEYAGAVLIVDESSYYDNELYLVFRGIATFDEDDYLPTAVWFPAYFTDVSTNGTDPEYPYVYIDGWDYMNYDSYDSTEGYVNPHEFCESLADSYGMDCISFEGEIGNFFFEDGRVSTLSDISDLYMGYARERAKEVTLEAIMDEYRLSKSEITGMKTIGEYLLLDPDEDDAAYLIVIVEAHLGGSYNKTLYFPVEYDEVLCFGDYGYTDEYADPWYNNDDELGYDDVQSLHWSFTQYMTDYYSVEASPEIEAYAG